MDVTLGGVDSDSDSDSDSYEDSELEDEELERDVDPGLAALLPSLSSFCDLVDTPNVLEYEVYAGIVPQKDKEREEKPKQFGR